jgi:chaperonin GroES
MATTGMNMMGGQQSPGISPMGEAPFQPAQVPLTPPEPEEQETEDEKLEREQEVSFHKKNLAEDMDEEELRDLGMECKQGFDADKQSMQDWLTANEEWSKLARQVKEEKTFPWPGAANIKYPLISTAALQFSARAYPALVPADKKIVKTRLWGKDPSGEKRKKGERIATFMSWQITEDMEWWEEDMDRMLIMNAVMGQNYKKTYYDPSCEKVVSHLVYGDNFIIDRWARSIKTCPRYTEIHEMTKQKIEELKLRNYFLDVDLGLPTGKDDTNEKDDQRDQKIVNDFTTPYVICEQHTWWDKDGDELREPYIVWFEQTTGKVIRVQARYDAEGIKTAPDKKGKDRVVGFKAKCYYTKFGFIPNPDGSFLDMGFGHLLGPINEAVNTNINQLTDAGTTNNLNSGFISKGLRLNMADKTWKPNEWKSVNATGDDLRKMIVPLPTKEPSPVLFQLLGMLIQSGKELASVAEIFTGKMPGQNTPATTTQATIEQGMKVFTAIYKRIYRSLDEEFKKIFYLNQYYLDPETYTKVLDEPIGPDDFDDDEYDVCPTADPTATTQGEKLQKAMALMDLMQLGLLDPMKVVMRVLEAQEQPNWEELIPGMAETGQPAPPQEKPDPKVQAQQEKAKTDQMLAQTKAQAIQQKAAMDQQTAETKMAMEAQQHAEERQHQMEMNQLEAQRAQQTNQIFMAEGVNKILTSKAEGQQKLAQKDEQHQQKLQHQKEVAKSTSKTSKTGKKAK